MQSLDRKRIVNDYSVLLMVTHYLQAECYKGGARLTSSAKGKTMKFAVERCGYSRGINLYFIPHCT